MCKDISLSSSSIGSSWFNVLMFVNLWSLSKSIHVIFVEKEMGDIFYNCWIIYAGSTWQNYHIIQGNNEIISFTMKWVQRSTVYNIFNSTFRLTKEIISWWKSGRCYMWIVTIGAFIASKMSESFFLFHVFKTKIFILLFSHDVILCFYSRG